MAKARLEVQLDRLAVTGQGRRLDIVLGLPPAQPPVQLISELGPPVVSEPPGLDVAHRGDVVLAAFLGRAAVDTRLAALPARAWRRRVPHPPAAVRELPRLGELHRATAVPAGREYAGGARVIACLIWPGAGPHQLVPACSCARSLAKYATYNVVAGPSDKLRPSWPGGFLEAGCHGA